jgi:hypothetical protein
MHWDPASCDPHGEEDRLRESVLEAIAALNMTRAERQELFALAEDVQGAADGFLAFQRATKMYGQALRDLRDALRRFEEFMDRRYGPPGPWPPT